jgi:hypothetical protein
MKRMLYVIFFVCFVSTGFSQSQQDQEEVLQLCIELQELQPFLVGNDGAQLSQLYIKSCEALQTKTTSINKFGNPIRFVDKVELKALHINSYIDFYIFEVLTDKARIDFTFSSDLDTPKFWAYMELEKNGDSWEITKLKSEER